MTEPDEGYSIEGFVSLHELHPELREILVEGRVDAGIIRWYMDEQDFDLDVFDIDDRIVVPANEEYEPWWSGGKRARLLAAANAIRKEGGPNVSGVMCVVDSDFDFLAKRNKELAYVEFTDLASLELQTITKESLTRFKDLFIHSNPDLDVVGAVHSVIPPLVDLFIVRFLLSEHIEDSPKIIDKVEECVIFPRGKPPVADARGMLQSVLVDGGARRTNYQV